MEIYDTIIINGDNDGDTIMEVGIVCNEIVYWYKKMHECIDEYKE